jgi:hypothetical protein
MLDGRQQYIAMATAGGESVNHQAEHLKVSPPAVCSRKDTIAKRAKAFWGNGVLADVQMQPLWRRAAEQRGGRRSDIKAPRAPSPPRWRGGALSLAGPRRRT